MVELKRYDDPDLNNRYVCGWKAGWSDCMGTYTRNVEEMKKTCHPVYVEGYVAGQEAGKEKWDQIDP